MGVLLSLLYIGRIGVNIPMKYRKVLTAILLLYSALLLVACHSIPPKQPTTVEDIRNELVKGAAINRSIANKSSKRTVPAEVHSVLLPNKTFSLPGKAELHKKRFNISVKDVPAKSFFTGLVKGTPYSVVINPQVQGTISLDLKNVTIEQVLQAVRDAYGYDYKTTAYGFEVIPAGIQTEIFTVNYLNISRSGETETSVSGGQPTTVQSSSSSSTGSTGSSSKLNNPKSSVVRTKSTTDMWVQLRDTVLSVVGDGEGRSVVVDPQAGIVVVRAFPNELKKVAEYLHTIQSTMNRQVLLEAKILEVALNDGFQTGINWNILKLQQGLQDATIDAFNNVFTLNITSGGAFSAVIKMLASQGNVQVLSSPRVSTVNNQKAVIKVGSDEYFVTGVTSSTLATGGGADTSSDVELTPFFSGIALDVTPQIDSRGNVILHIHPSISEVKEQEKRVTVNSQEMQLPLAKSSIRESDSIVRAKSGQVVVIGGLMSSTRSETIDATPFAGDVPLIGSLFRNTKQAAVKSELVILLRPIVVNNDTWHKQLDRAAKRYYHLDRGFHYGSKPGVFGNLGEKRPSWARP